MGLFDFFKKRGPAEEPAKPKAAEESLIDYSGLRVEVLSQDGQLLFVAKLSVFPGGVAELQQISEDTEALGELLSQREQEIREHMQEQDPEHYTNNPEILVTLAVHLRGFDKEQEMAVHFSGDIHIVDHRVWRVEKLKLTGKDNERAYFRQSIQVEGQVTPIGQLREDPTEVAAMLNISAGGVGMSSAVEFDVGQRLLLRANLAPSQPPLSLTCNILRKTKRRGGFDYGCQFVGLSPAEEDQLSRVIVQLQMRKKPQTNYY